MQLLKGKKQNGCYRATPVSREKLKQSTARSIRADSVTPKEKNTGKVPAVFILHCGTATAYLNEHHNATNLLLTGILYCTTAVCDLTVPGIAQFGGTKPAAV